jgi:hypothetical protein
MEPCRGQIAGGFGGLHIALVKVVHVYGLGPIESVGKVAPGNYNGLKVSGSYGPLWVIENDYVPAGYLAVVSTYGANSPNNCIGFRQHVQVQYQGLRTIPGTQPVYPIQDAFFSRSFGVGVRRRGQAAVMQIKETGTYDVPVIPK